MAELAREAAVRFDLDHTLSFTEEFPVTVNDPEVVSLIERAATARGLECVHRSGSFRWSEDFGWFTRAAPGALFGLGAGEGSPPLHGPCYDFPDALLGPGVELLTALVREILS